ncbi:MAG: hypothetical protein HFH23_09350 [Ruminococcus sp.]|nr:hypothetical protein [Ruminococcus sp.]
MREIGHISRKAGSRQENGRGDTVLLKQCRCGRLIPQTMKVCEACEARYMQRYKSRHMEYNETRRDKRAAEFYLSKEWRGLRAVIMNVYGYVDIYALYVLHELQTLDDSDPVHHIVELDEDWEQRLNPLNLIPMKKGTHSMISALYKRGDAARKATQKQLKSLVGRHFEGAGGYEKVLERAGLVAPPSFFGENSPRKFQETGVVTRSRNPVPDSG